MISNPKLKIAGKIVLMVLSVTPDLKRRTFKYFIERQIRQDNISFVLKQFFFELKGDRLTLTYTKIFVKDVYKSGVVYHIMCKFCLKS